jgi:hypothetical protein
MSISQKQSVVNAVTTTLGTRYVSTSAVKSILTKEELAAVRSLVLADIQAGNVAIGKNYDINQLRRYVNGMVDNHLRKAKELNGGTTYHTTGTRKAKTPKDPQLNALKKLAKTLKSDNPEFTKVQAAISARESELNISQPTCTKAPVLDEELQAIVDEM